MTENNIPTSEDDFDEAAYLDQLKIACIPPSKRPGAKTEKPIKAEKQASREKGPSNETLQKLQAFKESLKDVPAYEPPATPSPSIPSSASSSPNPFDFDPSEFNADRYLEMDIPEPDYLFRFKAQDIDVGSLRPRTQNIIFGCPGTGKSMWAIQCAVALASGTPWGNTWTPVKPRKVLYLGCEDEEAEVATRVKTALNALPVEYRSSVKDYLCARSFFGKGSMHLFKGSGTDLTKSDMFNRMFEFIGKHHFELVICDTIYNFFPVSVLDDIGIGIACDLITEQCFSLNTSILWLNHAIKQGNSIVGNAKDFESAIDLSAMRFGSTFSGRMRWIMALAPLKSKYAFDLGCIDAENEPDGTFIAARVVKKNSGGQEYEIFLKHDSATGYLHYSDRDTTKAKGFQPCTKEVAETLVEAVRRRYENNEQYICKSKPWTYPDLAQEYPSLPHTSWEKAVNFAIDHGMLKEGKNVGKNGTALFLPSDPNCVPAMPTKKQLKKNLKSGGENVSNDAY